LKTTDVFVFLWENSLEIAENYSFNNKVNFIVNYITSGTGHPDFVLTALESHHAEIILTMDGKVVDAKCLHETVGEKIKYWDLIDQRWGWTGGVVPH
jgi:hypothetical protein